MALIAARSPARHPDACLLEFLLADVLITVLVGVCQTAPQEARQFVFREAVVLIIVKPLEDPIGVARHITSTGAFTGPFAVAVPRSSSRRRPSDVVVFPFTAPSLGCAMFPVFLHRRLEFGCGDIAIIILIGFANPRPEFVGHFAVDQFAIAILVEAGQDRARVRLASGRAVTPGTPPEAHWAPPVTRPAMSAVSGPRASMPRVVRVPTAATAMGPPSGSPSAAPSVPTRLFFSVAS